MVLTFDPAAIPREQIPAVISELAAAQSMLAARLVDAVIPEPAPAENYISVAEASKRYHRSPKWFYRNAKRLPFMRRLSRKVLLVGERGMERWIANQR